MMAQDFVDSTFANVTKSDGRLVAFSSSKILRRIRRILPYLPSYPSQEKGITSRSCDDNAFYSHEFRNDSACHPYINEETIVQKLRDAVTQNCLTSLLDVLLIETCQSMQTIHPDFGALAGGLAITRLWKSVDSRFSETICTLFAGNQNRNFEESAAGFCISDELHSFVLEYKNILDSSVVVERDLQLDLLSVRTLERSYLLKLDGKIAERPQHMFMRVACAMHLHDIDSAVKTYHLMSQKYFIHATPTLCSAGTRSAQMCSCFLMPCKDPTIRGIFDTVKNAALISSAGGGIGISCHCIKSRAADAEKRSTSAALGIPQPYPREGLLPFLRILNETSRFVSQIEGRRKGAFAIYLEPWHPDIFQYLDIRKNHGNAETRARDLFSALWVPDLFMKRVKSDEKWTLMDPGDCPGLNNHYGKQFEEIYVGYEREGRGCATLQARDLWQRFVSTLIETGTPYLLFKDACNEMSNQQHLGCIQGSNLCTEIVQFSSSDEVAVCNLASISVNKFCKASVITEGRFCGDDAKEVLEFFDFKFLDEVVAQVVRNLNNVIDSSTYPIPEAKKSNMRHRPIGIGIQGMADLFAKLHIAFESEYARLLNLRIFEQIYYSSLRESCNLAKLYGSYETFIGSPASRGLLQFDLFYERCNRLAKIDNDSVFDLQTLMDEALSLDWNALKADIIHYGLRNSLVTAPMPTASTAHILGNSESFSPYLSNIYRRSVLAGEFSIVHSYLVKCLHEKQLWNSSLKDKIVANGGSIQSLETIPANVKDVFKTVWEIKQRCLIDRAAERSLFIDQSQSMNLFVEAPSLAKVSSMLFYAWKRNLKTGIYYLRTRSAADPIQVTISHDTFSDINLSSRTQFHPQNLSNLVNNNEVSRKAAVSTLDNIKRRCVNSNTTYLTTQADIEQPTGLLHSSSSSVAIDRHEQSSNEVFHSVKSEDFSDTLRDLGFGCNIKHNDEIIQAARSSNKTTEENIAKASIYSSHLNENLQCHYCTS